MRKLLAVLLFGLSLCCGRSSTEDPPHPPGRPVRAALARREAGCMSESSALRARSRRCSGVMVSRQRLPPARPIRLAALLKALFFCIELTV